MPIRRVALIAALAVACGLVHAQPVPPRAEADNGPVKVLFIGNSYTYYHRMPDTVSAMARADGNARPLHAKVVAVPSATLQRHWDAGTALAAIRERQWDYVVLQEQSLLPIEHRQRMHEYVRLFDKEIKQNGARTVLFLTWARRDRKDMQRDLDAAYGAIAEEVGALVAPVGPAWQAARQGAPDLPLHEEDGSHPTPVGSYLTACVLYLALQPAQHQCPVLPGLPGEAADAVRAAVASTLARPPR